MTSVHYVVLCGVACPLPSEFFEKLVQKYLDEGKSEREVLDSYREWLRIKHKAMREQYGPHVG